MIQTLKRQMKLVYCLIVYQTNVKYYSADKCICPNLGSGVCKRICLKKIIVEAMD